MGRGESSMIVRFFYIPKNRQAPIFQREAAFSLIFSLS